MRSLKSRSKSIDDNALDRAYYEALKNLMGKTDSPTYVTGYKIWNMSCCGPSEMSRGRVIFSLELPMNARLLCPA